MPRTVVEGSVQGTQSAVSKYDTSEIKVEKSEDVGKPRMGLGSTANENIALRRNYREMEMLWKKQKILGDEEVYVLKLIDLYEKSVQLNYKRLTKRVSRIKSHLTEEEIIEMENDLRKKEFADKYRMLLHNQESSGNCAKNSQPAEETGLIQPENGSTNRKSDKSNPKELEVIAEEPNNLEIESSKDDKNSKENASTTTAKNANVEFRPSESLRSQTCQVTSSRSSSLIVKRRPETSPNLANDESSSAMNEIIPSLEDLIDQLHNIKPHQFYENQRKLKLYEIRLLEEELDARKEDLFKAVDGIINWDKKEEKKEEEEEEKPRQRKTSFMRSVLRNFSMELMMKTMQYGWTDLGQCRYLRNRGGDCDDTSGGVNTLAKDTMKISLNSNGPDESAPADGAPEKRIDPGFDANGKMIRTADLLGLKQED